MIYLDKHLVLYSPLEIDYDQDIALFEAKYAIEQYGAWIASKLPPGEKIEKPDLSNLPQEEADRIEKESRLKQRNKWPKDFPVKGVLLRGIKGLNYGFNYLVADTSKYEWTKVSEECPYLCSIVNQLPFEKLGRVNIQTVEAGMSLHKHIDSSFRMNSETIKRRKISLNQYGIKDFNLDVNCIITIVLQGSGINFYYTRSNEKIKMNDNVYYFRPDLIHHSIDISNQQRIICRIEGIASYKMIDWIEANAEKNSDRVLVI